MNKVYLALGSNISPRMDYLNKAMARLNEVDGIQILEHSSIYETMPVGSVEQSDFLNQVVELETSFQALDLLKICQGIEDDLGRVRDVRWGPRTIDLDILLYNEEHIKMDQLIVPHPRMHERAFVLVPLNDLDPNIKIPVLNKMVSEQLALLTNEERRGVKKWIKSDGVED